MARTFNGSQSLYGAITYTDGLVHSHFCRGYANNATHNGSLSGLWVPASGGNFSYLLMAGGLAGDPVRYTYNNDTTVQFVDSVSGFSANVWAAVGGYNADGTTRAVFIDGAKTTQSAAAGGFGITPTRFAVGQGFTNSTTVNSLNGNAQGAALWGGIALTDAEMVSLAKGFPARRIRPQALRVYMPLVRNVFDWKGAVPSITDSSGGAADNPRMYGF